MTSFAPSATPEVPGLQLGVALVAAALVGSGAAFLADAEGWRQATLWAVGTLLGVALYHAAFGFTGAWRAFLVERRGDGVRAQMLMLALATVVFLPVLDHGALFGRPVAGAFAPVGLSVAIGAFLFGIGMQLGGGCGSGALFTLGGGSLRMLVTLAFFVVGSVAATADPPWWSDLPHLGGISLSEKVGLGGALAAQLAAFAAIAGATLAWERRRREPSTAAAFSGRRLVRGPWPFVWGAVALAALNVATLALSGAPWAITFAFSLWGAKALQAAGVDVWAWEFWTASFPAGALEAPLTRDVTTVMDVGIVLGALLAAGLAGRFAPGWTSPWRPLAAAALGGLLLGYGARLAFGCNIGAFFSGVASGSLHGWLWIAAAIPGNYVGVLLRPAFGLEVARAPRERV
jgi:hypothetical protein